MRNPTFHTILVIISLLVAAGSQAGAAESPGESGIRGGFYFAEEIGWAMPIPEGWEVMETDTLEALQERGQEAISETSGVEISTQGLKNLLNLQKAQPNNFQSSIEPFVENYEGEWHDNNAGLKELLIQTYLNAGLGVEVSETSLEDIDGVVFEFYEFRILTADGREALRQAMFSSLINGYDFGATASYNDPEFGNQLLEAFRASKFRETDR